MPDGRGTGGVQEPDPGRPEPGRPGLMLPPAHPSRWEFPSRPLSGCGRAVGQRGTGRVPGSACGCGWSSANIASMRALISAVLIDPGAGRGGEMR
ncbi:hypothetical protein FXW78_45765 [Rhodococcus opacus]|nr:hypothetical protein [Rhodococcus opacus]